jgi:hypothetical protein
MKLSRFMKKKIKKIKLIYIKNFTKFILFLTDQIIMILKKLKVQVAKHPSLCTSKVDKKALKWAQFNPWFGRDYYLTEKALDIHHILIRSGIKSTTTRYYHEIDKRMYFYFKDHLKKYYSMEN